MLRQRRHTPTRMLPLLLLALALALALRSTAAQTPPPPADIYLIRHAEKLTDGRPDLSPLGFERATLLPGLFIPPPTSRRASLPLPQVLFAARATPGSNRSVQTITPLSVALHLPIDSTIDDKDFATLAATLLSGKYAGRVVLVAWHRGSLAAFAAALGVQPRPAAWPEPQFDRLWRIVYTDGKATLTDMPQHLLPGDSNSPSAPPE